MPQLPERESAQAFVLAAGFGTRLRPLTEHRPKPLVPVCGVTVLDQALGLCQRHGIGRVVVNAHHLADQILRHCASLRGLDIHVQVEQPEILGTGGGLRLAMSRLADPLVVLNGDVLCDGDLTALLASSVLPGTSAAMLLRPSPEVARYGLVAPDTEGRVVRLSSVAVLAGVEPARHDTHFTGLHAVRRAALELLPPQGFACVVRSAYRLLVPQGAVRAVVHGGYWLDVGSPEDYLEANLAVLRGEVELPVDVWQRAGLGWRRLSEGLRWRAGGVHLEGQPQLIPPLWLGVGARIRAGAVLGPDVVVGPGAEVGAGAHLRQSVVWDRCAVAPGARLTRAVVFDGGVLRF